MPEDRTAELRYGQDYEETVKLRDGSKAYLRPIHPEDRELLLEGFERLSPESRYTRFLAPKSTLTDRELDYLTNVDGQNHFAIVAFSRNLLGREEGLGVGRFVRLADKPDTAEPAVTVADDQQGKGLGTILLDRLCEAAWERGIRWFRSELLAKNTVMREVIEDISPEASFKHVGDGVMAATFRLAEPEPTPDTAKRELGFRGTALYRLLSTIARREDIALSQRNTAPPER